MLLCEISQNHKNTILFHGEGAIQHLDEVLPDFSQILVFTDKNGFAPCGAAAYFESYIKNGTDESNLHFFPYTGKALPLEDIEAVYQEVRKVEDAEAFVAVGGGTIIDLAKIIAIAYSNHSTTITEILENRQLQNTLELIFVPTTAGTGSEATSFAVVYRDKVKLSLDNPSVLPDYVVLDPCLLVSLPEAVLNSVILDALAQAVESVWARGTTRESRQYAAQAITTIVQHYPQPQSIQRLDALLWASHLAGKAINISRTTLSHAISYPLTSHFSIPHGIAVFLSLPQVARFNYSATADSLQPGLDISHITSSFEILFETFEVKTIEQLIHSLEAVMRHFKLSPRLRDHGVPQEALPFLAQQGITPGRSDNNPRQANPQTILAMLENIF